MTNKYFEEMEKVGAVFNELKRAREEEKEAIIEQYGYDSEELKAFREKEKEKELKFPYNNAQMKAYWAWQYTEENNLETFTLNEFLWEKEIEDFVKTMKDAGVTEFVYTCTSTALMDNIHDLEAAGYKMTGLAELKFEDRWSDRKVLRGLRFEAE